MRRGRDVMRRAAAATILASVLLLAVGAVALLEIKSVEYGLPVSELLEPDTARLWVYESITDEGLLAPAPAFVKVRWRTGTDAAVRAMLEARYGLVPSEARERGTWVYTLRRFSHHHVRTLLDDPAAEDTEGFDRRGFVIPAESLSVAIERAVRFAPAHVFLTRFSGHRRAWLTDAVRRLADPLTQWAFCGGVAAIASIPLVLGAGSHRLGTKPVARGFVRFAEDLVLSKRGGRSLRSAAGYTVLVAVALGGTHRSSLLPQPQLTNSPFAVRAMDLAITRGLCGTISSVAPVSPGSEVLREESLTHVPIPELVARFAGDIPSYCAAATPFRSPENTPMLLMSGVLLWAPHVSLSQLGHALHTVKLALIIAAGFMCLAMGTSIVATYLLAAVAISVLERIGASYVQYSFLGLMLAVVAVAWAFVQRSQAPRTPAYDRAAAALLGVLTALAVHVRSSHAPIYLAFLVLYVVLTVIKRRRTDVRLPTAAAHWATAVVVAFAGGYVTFVLTFIAPIDRATVDSAVNYTRHATAHAVVLALSLSSPDALKHPETVPGNDLARREGLTFDDAKGIELARRVDPAAQYLHPSYESALWTYYLRLWRDHPGEMGALYWQKFELTGHGMRQYLRGGSPNRVLNLAGKVIDAVWPSPIPLFVLYVLVFAGAVAAHGRTSSSTACLLAFFSLAAILVYLEATIINPEFRLAYYNFMPIYIGTVAVLGVQSAVTQASRIIGWRTQNAV